MTSHFDMIGFPVDSAEQLRELAKSVADQANDIPTKTQGFYRHYATPEGCELWLQYSSAGEFVGCHPHFVGSSKYSASLAKAYERESHPLNGQVVVHTVEGFAGLPIIVNIPNYRMYGDSIVPPVSVTMQISAFAQRAEVFDTLEEFERSSYSKMNPEGTLIPGRSSGDEDDSDDDPQPIVVMAGRIQSVTELVNSFSGKPFYAMELMTLGGVIDIVADSEMVGCQPKEDGIVVGSFFMSGVLAASKSDSKRRPASTSESGYQAAEVELPVSLIEQYTDYVQSDDYRAILEEEVPHSVMSIAAGVLMCLTIFMAPFGVWFILSTLNARKEALKKVHDRELKLAKGCLPLMTYPLMADTDLLTDDLSSAPGIVLGSFEQAATVAFMESLINRLNESEEGRADALTTQCAEYLFDGTEFQKDRRRKLPSEVTEGVLVFAFDLVIRAVYLPDNRRKGAALPCMASEGDKGQIRHMPYKLVEAAQS